MVVRVHFPCNGMRTFQSLQRRSARPCRFEQFGYPTLDTIYIFNGKLLVLKTRLAPSMDSLAPRIHTPQSCLHAHTTPPAPSRMCL